MKQKKSVMYIFLEGAAALAVILMLGLFPLYFQDNYLDMSKANQKDNPLFLIGSSRGLEKYTLSRP